MRSDFRGFERAFADTSNYEVLLNLARLANRDPTYFFKLGQITSTYKTQASLTAAGNFVTQNVATAGNAQGGGTPFAFYETSAGVTFIPVNDDTNAQLLLKAVPPETFYILFHQGWRADQLMRLMIDRMEISWRQKDGSCLIETIRNSPPPVRSIASVDAENITNYVTFLRVSALAYSLQKHGYLLLSSTSHFASFDAEQGSTLEPSPADVAIAASRNTTWRNVKGKWQLGQIVHGVQFVLSPPPGTHPGAEAIAAIAKEIANGNELQELREGDSLQQTLAALSRGFSIDGSSASTLASADSQSGAQCGAPHLITRSLLGLMTAAAQEQEGFDALLESSQPVQQSRWFPPTDNPLQPFRALVPRMEQQPILRISGSGKGKDLMPVAQVDYRGKSYFVGDTPAAEVAENQYWNRDMFRLLSQLQSQVTVDISKFPLPTILQLNTQ